MVVVLFYCLMLSDLSDSTGIIYVVSKLALFFVIDCAVYLLMLSTLNDSVRKLLHSFS